MALRGRYMHAGICALLVAVAAIAWISLPRTVPSNRAGCIDIGARSSCQGNASGDPGPPAGGSGPELRHDSNQAPATPSEVSSSGNSDTQPSPRAGEGLECYPPDVLPQFAIPVGASERDLRDLLKSLKPSDDRAYEAQLRLHFRFHSWRGRDSGGLGGFAFEQKAFAVLDNWDMVLDDIAVTSLLPERERVPPVAVQRTMLLSKGTDPQKQEGLTIEIEVCLSAEIAQQRMLRRSVSGAGMNYPKVAQDSGISVGDAMLLYARNVADSGTWDRVFFSRRNVWVSIRPSPAKGASSSTIDLDKLCRNMDSQIIDQTVSAAGWADLKAICPLVREFRVDDHMFMVNSETRKDVHMDVQPREGMDLAFLPLRGDFVMCHAMRDTARIDLLLDQYAKDPFEGRQELPATAWLVVADKHSLYFSVAKIDLTLKR